MRDAAAFAVRLEHRLAPAAAMLRWSCPAVVVICETLQPRGDEDALSTAVLAACVPTALRFVLSATTVRLPTGALAVGSSLTSFDASGLTALKSVGDDWFSGCSSLTSFDSSGLTALTAVGHRWFAGCSSLTSFNATGLTALTTVGGLWFFCCSSLTSVETTGLTALTTAGDGWFNRCSSLTSVGTSGLTALTSAGHSWFFNCSSLTSVDVTRLTSLGVMSYPAALALRFHA
jgi:hypothetical protein